MAVCINYPKLSKVSYLLMSYRVSQDTIKPALDIYCQDNNLPLISTSTIGRLIKRLKEQGLISVRNKKYTSALEQDVYYKRIHKLRRKGYQPTDAGSLLQAESIKIRFNGQYKYLITAIDIKSRFAFATTAHTLNSLQAKNFLEGVKASAPFNIERIQTDNGSEFDKYFADFVKKEHIAHYQALRVMPSLNVLTGLLKSNLYITTGSCLATKRNLINNSKAALIGTIIIRCIKASIL